MAKTSGGTLPVVAIVGRPNVGKSSLFNRLAGALISIVDPSAGVTRDRVSAILGAGSWACEIVDTGGIGMPPDDELRAEVEAQIAIAMDRADLILWAVDARDGVTAGDRQIAERLRTLGKPVLVAANKTDSVEIEPETAAFYSLGFGEPSPVSALSGYNVAALKTRIRSLVRAKGKTRPPEEPELRVAVVGRRNAGKSSFINALAREERVIVSEVPGTTRDSVDVRIEAFGKSLVVVDTAGFRKKKAQLKESLDFYAMVRGERAIRRAHVAVLLMDAREEVGEVEKKLGDMILTAGKPVIVGVNKWDLAGEVNPEKYNRYLEDRLPGLAFAPRLFLSAKTGLNSLEVIRLAFELNAQAEVRVETGPLNRAIREAAEERLPKAHGRRFPRIYYGTQVGVRPPTIVLFVNDTRMFDDGYRRYLAERLRRKFPFSEVPVRFVFRGREDRERKDPGKKNTGRPQRRPAKSRR